MRVGRNPGLVWEQCAVIAETISSPVLCGAGRPDRACRLRAVDRVSVENGALRTHRRHSGCGEYRRAAPMMMPMRDVCADLSSYPSVRFRETAAASAPCLLASPRRCGEPSKPSCRSRAGAGSAAGRNVRIQRALSPITACTKSRPAFQPCRAVQPVAARPVVGSVVVHGQYCHSCLPRY